VTLVFLGYLPEKKVAEVAQTAFEPVRGLAAPELSVRAVRPVPARDPRLFAFDLSDVDGRAGAVQAVASDALASARFYKPEKRQFWPHVTFARVKRGQRRVPPIDAEPPQLEAFEATDVVLYRSHLSPRGARYEALETVRLGL